MNDSNRTGLVGWLKIWHPRYRWMLFALFVAAGAAGGITYLENSLLQGLVESLASDTASRDSGVVIRLVSALGPASYAPFLFLGALFVAGFVRALIAMRRNVVSSSLYISARNDLEGEILRNLLFRDDGFYASHAMGEIMNRLEVDLARALDRRQTVIEVWWSSLLVVSNLLFFGLTDWRLALVVVAICSVGTAITQWVSRPIRAADKNYFDANDQVKMDFEDYLRAVPEIQVGGLFEAILRRFRKPQSSRQSAYMAWNKADVRIGFTRTAWPVVAFMITVVVVLWAGRLNPETSGEQLSIIPVLIFALPGMFANVTYLVNLRTRYQLAANSMARILEYEAANVRNAPAAGIAAAEDPGRLRIDVRDVSYQYRSENGELQGGISEVTTSFETGKWYAVVGGAGSGKSTLINTLLGRQVPQRGATSYVFDGKAVEPDELPRISTLMPQRVVLFDTTIRGNLVVGMPGADEETSLAEEDLAVVEGLGLADICRRKALDMRPAEVVTELGAEDVAALRKRAAAAAEELKIGLAPFDKGSVDPSRPVFDALLGGRTELDAALTALLAGKAPRWIAALSPTPLADQLVEHARFVVEQSKNLLAVESYRDFVQLTAEPIDERMWRLRRECLTASSSDRASASDRLQAIRTGLTCMPSEWEGDPARVEEFFARVRKDHAAVIQELRKVVSATWRPFHADRVHPYLTWRDNLLFGAASVTNQRARKRLDAALITIMEDPRWAPFFTAQGLEYSVGRNGSRLSGGQGQLVSMARSVLRKTPLLVLDEPTSALDPASRERVAKFMSAWKKKRVVVSISHDPELTRFTDEVNVMEQGRLVARGSFDELTEKSETFRRIFQLSQGGK
jgi:ABC-type multidrug transport system fused ATPase/permease subunit